MYNLPMASNSQGYITLANPSINVRLAININRRKGSKHVYIITNIPNNITKQNVVSKINKICLAQEYGERGRELIKLGYRGLLTNEYITLSTVYDWSKIENADLGAIIK